MLEYYVRGRRFEWMVTIAMLWLAIAIAISPDIIRASAFQWLVTLVISPFAIDAALLVVGWTRLIGLLLNGHEVRGKRIGPIIRSVTAICCAVMWVQFDLALIQLSFEHGYMSPGVPFWSMFVVAELDVAYRAVADDGRNT